MSETARPVTIEEVLAETGWLRALARDLVRDPATADDVVQETLLAALRHPPVVRTSLRGWLRRVARNSLLARRRSGDRRRAREQAAHRKDQAPAAEETVLRAEEQRRVIEAALALAEPFRSTILLRYFDGLSPTEIAVRTGTDAATVRTRSHRALGKLRTALSEGRPDWRASLLPLALFPSREAAALTTGGIAMTVSTKIALATVVVVLAVGGGAVLLSPGDSSEPPPTPAPVVTDVAEISAEVPQEASTEGDGPAKVSSAATPEKKESAAAEDGEKEEPATSVPENDAAVKRHMAAKVAATFVTVEMSDATIRQVLESMERDTGIRIWINAAAEGAMGTKVNVNYVDTRLTEALRFLSMYGNFEFEVGARGIEIR